MRTVQAAVEEFGGELTANDQRIVGEILADPTGTAFMSAESLAGRVGVHAASVVRLAKKLGFSGYPQLRASLQHSLRQAFQPADRVVRSLGATDGSILTTVVGEELERLSLLAEHVTDDDLATAAEMVAKARRVVLFGHGHSTALTTLLQRRLRRSGFVAERVTADARDLAETMVGIGADDLLIGFALRTVPPTLVALLEHTTGHAIPSVLISDAIGPTIRPRPSVLLSAPRGMQDRFLTLTVPMVICDALVLAVAGHDGGRSLSALEELGQLLDAFED